MSMLGQGNDNRQLKNHPMHQEIEICHMPWPEGGSQQQYCSTKGARFVCTQFR